MPAQALCLTPGEARQLVDGTLSTVRFKAVERHVEECAHCQQALDTVQGMTIPTPQFHPPLPLPQVPGYDVLEEIGAGGMGMVYKARKQGTGQVVALKMVRRDMVAAPERRRRFQREAEAAGRLLHPNIVTVHDTGEVNDQLYFTMDYVQGVTLRQRLSGISFAQAAKLIETLARAVHHAHEHHVIHRDLKPENVLIGADNTPRVADFGLAKLLDDEDVLTRTRELLGTPYYMAPEQTRGKAGTAAIGPATDVWALGVMFYEMLTGNVPFQGAAIMEILAMVQTDEPVAPRTRRKVVPQALEVICLKCLRKEPENRYQSALELAEDLRRNREQRPNQAQPIERIWKWARRHPVAVSLLLVLTLLLPLCLFGAAKLAPTRQTGNQVPGRERAPSSPSETPASGELDVKP